MNLPNLLSLLRLVLVPVFAVVFLSGVPNATVWGLAVYVAASLTDVLDGYIARHSGQVTMLGRILDPLADKLMGGTVLVCICLKGLVPWWAACIFIIKELMMMSGGIFIYRANQDVPPSNILGKAATASFFTVCVLLLLFPGIPETAATVMIAAALALSVAALIRYACCYLRLTAKNVGDSKAK